jgi:hypothetical protein
LSKLTEYFLKKLEEEWKPYYTNVSEGECDVCKEKVYVWVNHRKWRLCHDCINLSFFSKVLISTYEKIRYEKNIQRRLSASNTACKYKGIWFRSKFERDLFILFDALSLEVWYECKWFGDYLPDFYLKDLRIWIEGRGYDRRDDIEHFVKYYIQSGIFEGKPFSTIPDLLDNVTIDPKYYVENDDYFTKEDIEYIIEKKKNELSSSALDRYLVLTPIKVKNAGQHNYKEDDCTCTQLYDHQGNVLDPILVRIGGMWEIKDNYEFKKCQHIVNEAYYIYYFYKPEEFSGKKKIPKISKVFLKNKNKNNKICVEKFIERFR